MDKHDKAGTYPSNPIPDSLKGPYYETYMNEDPWEWKDPEMRAWEEEETKHWVAQREAKQKQAALTSGIPKARSG